VLLKLRAILCRMRRQQALVIGLVAVVLVAGLGGYGGYRVWRHFRAAAPAPAPKTAVVVQAPTPTPETVPTAAAPTPTPAPTPLPPSVFVRVPYTAQSPFNQWGAGNPHEEYCEAAAILMVGQYFRGDTRDRIPPAEADASMGQIVATERRTFPGVLDLPLTDIGAVGNQLYNLRPAISPVDPDVIERNLAEGRPVIVPVMTHGANGQKISPYYGSTNVYHVIVLTGYDAGKGLFYTNDAGFVQGQNFAYPWSTLSTAIDAQAAKQGRVMLVFDRM
jgi:Peptidase_C39 like family